jgi:hypothetical protein
LPYEPGLVFNYKFENNLKDFNTWNLHGSSFNGSVSYVAGKFGNAVELNDRPIEVGTEGYQWGSTEYNGGGPRGNTSKFTEMKYNMTLEAWINPSVDDGERKIMAKHNYWDGGYALVLKQFDGTLRIGLLTNMTWGGPDTTVWDGDCNGLRGAYSSVQIPLNQWTHVGAAFDPTQPDADTGDLSVGRIRIYVNGEDVTTSMLFTTNSCWAQPQAGEDFMTPYAEIAFKNPSECSWCATALSVGGLNWSDVNANFIGKLDEVKLWNITKDAAYFDGQIPPSITKVEGISNYDKLYVEFSEGVYTDSNGTGNLQPIDLILTDSDDSRSILSVQHTEGTTSAILTLSSALDGTDDVGIDKLAFASDSVYDDLGDTAGFTDDMTITAMPSPAISSVEGAVGSNKLLVTFSDGIYTDTGQSGDLQPSDFVLTDSDNGRSIIAVDHMGGIMTAILTLSSAMDDTDDFLVDRLAAAGGEIFDDNDYPATTTPVMIVAQDPITIVAVTGQVGYNKLEVRFSGTVYSEIGATGSLQPGDFSLADSDNGRTITAVDHTPGIELTLVGEDVALLTLDSTLDITDDINVDTLAANGIYNFIDVLVDETPVTITEMPAAVISSVEGVLGSDKLKVNFSHWVYGDTGKTGTLAPSAFTFTDVGGDNPRTISAVQHGVGDMYAIITMSAPLISADIGADTIAAVTASIFDSYDHPVGTTAAIISAQTTPTITSAEGTVGLDQILVFFSEGVYADTGQSGALQAADFLLTDTDDSRTITAVNHTAGTASALLTLSSTLDSTTDIGTDTLAANDIYNKLDSAVDTTPVTLTGSNCPVGGAIFNFSEGAGSATVTDETGLLTGSVGNPSFSMQGDGLYTGDETEAELHYIDVTNTNLCLKSPRAITLESRFYMGDVDLDYVDISPANGIDDDYDVGIVEGNINSRNGDGRNCTYNRLAERKRTFEMTITRASFGGDYIEARKDKARVLLKYRSTVQGYCDGTFPGDPTTIGNGAWMKQISSDIDTYPIVTGHWYKIRIVVNMDKTRNVIDIFADDQGTDGSDTGELWTGYKNITKPDPEDSSACKWAAIPGIDMATEDQYLYIGDNPTHVRPGADDQGDYRNSTFKGKIDWLIWKPLVDYSGVDDPVYP